MSTLNYVEYEQHFVTLFWSSSNCPGDSFLYHSCYWLAEFGVNLNEGIVQTEDRIVYQLVYTVDLNLLLGQIK